MARHTLKIVAAGLGGWLLTASAFAATPAPAVRVAYTELDLSKDAGVEQLYARLTRAAEQVCGSVDIRDLASLAPHAACVRESLDRAVEAVHSARLSARHKGALAGERFAQAT